MICDLKRLNDTTFMCKNCGHVHSFEFGIQLPIYIECFSLPSVKNGLGDFVAWMLNLIGITPALMITLFGSCGCELRKTKLNRFGERVAKFLLRGTK